MTAPSRRALLRALALSPLAWLGRAPRAEAKDYTVAAEVLDAIDALEGDVGARLSTIAAALASARPLVRSLLADHARHRTARALVRVHLRLPAGPTPSLAKPGSSLDDLRAAQEALVYAHAEGLPALGDATSVAALAENMRDLARHLTIVDLWLEAEAARG